VALGTPRLSDQQQRFVNEEKWTYTKTSPSGPTSTWIWGMDTRGSSSNTGHRTTFACYPPFPVLHYGSRKCSHTLRSCPCAPTLSATQPSASTALALPLRSMPPGDCAQSVVKAPECS